ncbi:prolyl oligopeptidase family serine peptidase [Vibrio sp. V39_P1S14PM300]|uniref:prolyl oligopeptidase family serine peptidase n=1 Tax=Vibrio sp. V39_P1S14PM300 TaxID=1938690 RepID=UPI00137249E7|nr:prolyl oligopeptidase family serine peptidase [Vibrio sp. V39_P1S14PM300]NAX21793.1 prolyl oligopeptidase family serine peptidase [Vibrio sp. V39_P1S14PM300]
MKRVNVVLLSVSALTTNLSASEDFSWLRDDTRSSERVQTYLSEQNKLADSYLQHLQPLKQALIKEWSDSTPTKAQEPWTILGQSEFLLTVKDEKRVLLQRDRTTKQSKLLLDVESRAARNGYYQLANWSLSPNGRLLALAEDNEGNEAYRITLIDLKTLQERVIDEHSDTEILWSTNSTRLYTIRKTNGDLRPANLVEHNLESGDSRTVYSEADPGWLLSAYVASDKRYALLQVNNELSSEQRILNLNSGMLSAPIRTRKTGVEYYADIAENAVYLVSNLSGMNRLYRAALSSTSDWRAIYQPQNGAQLNTYYLFEHGIVLSERVKGQETFVILDRSGKVRIRQPLAESGTVGWLSRPGDYASNTIHIRSMSMIQPPKWEALDVADASRQLLSQDEYPNYRSDQYRTEQIDVVSENVQIPVTLAYKPSALSKHSPVILYGYGAYGFTMKPYFMPQITSLLDRGFIYAVAHVRGGGYFGESWYAAGRGVNKTQGVADFVHVAKALSEFQQGQRKVAAIGASAGGTLVAAAINQSPESFSAASLNVPFVDVIASMSDTRLPLTAQQYQEWGNPVNDRAAMTRYDPMSNIRIQAYPPLLVRVGWHDQRVPYWEGAKYLARISKSSTKAGPYLLKTDFQSGHATDRRNALAQQAMDYAFLIEQLQPSD